MKNHTKKKNNELEWLHHVRHVELKIMKEILGSYTQTKILEIEQQETDKQASGKQKLLDLGLTEEEVKALIGV